MSALALPLLLGPLAFAQDNTEQTQPEETQPETSPFGEKPLETLPDIELPDIPPNMEPSDPEFFGKFGDEDADAGEEVELDGVLSTAPDYSHLTRKQEHKVRLDALFSRLKQEGNADEARLIAEEIWAIWLDSGSPTVDMILLRGTAFEKRGEFESARRMYDHVMTLMPDYAEGWARSARLAMEEEDYDRALVDSTTALILEPREFYALWTMGNVLEKLGRTAQAYETYQAALELYPEHPAIKARVNTLQTQIDGEVL